VTVLVSRANPRSTWSGSHGFASSFSALRGLVEHARERAEAVQRDEPDCAPDRRVGAPARAEHVRAPVEAEGMPDRAVDDHERRRAAGAGDRPVEHERGIRHRRQRRDQDRHVVRPASRQHGVDCQLLGGDHAPADRLAEHDVVGREPGGLEEWRDRVVGGGDHGQAIRPSAREIEIDRLGPSGDLVRGGAIR
jgi:hypothetical protein